ncbi:hypothetical protein GEMRC1_013977 [Eukaryota sp. GEM-RC1]
MTSSVSNADDLELLRQGKVHPERSTLFTSFQRSVQFYASRDCQGRRLVSLSDDGTEKLQGSIFFSYQEVLERIERISSGLLTLPLSFGDRVGILSPSRPEWLTVDLACSRSGLVLVPLYESVSLDEILHVANDSEISVLFLCQKRFSLLADLCKSIPSLKYIILLDDTPSEKKFFADVSDVMKVDTVNTSFENGCYTHLLSELESLSPTTLPPVNVTRSDIASIVYSSGTLGKPKGCVLTQENILYGAANLLNNLPDLPHPDFQDVVLSYLPLAHIFQRAAEHALLSMGAYIGYYSGDISTLLEDIQLFKPTMLLGVPRVFQKLYDSAYKQIQTLSAVKSLIFRSSFNRKLNRQARGRSTPILDKLLFKKGLHAKLGGRLRAAFSGSAPLDIEVHKALEVLMCIPIGNGYASTETSSSGAVADLDDYEKNGNCGRPKGSIEMRLESLPDLGYTVEDKPYPRGEVLFSGPSVFKGYWKLEEKTKEALVEIDGKKWYKTGDVGMVDERGRLTLIDRKSTIIKSPHGEFIKLGPLTTAYSKCEGVEHLLLVGGATKLVAVLSLDVEYLPDKSNVEEIIEVENQMMSRFEEIANENGFRAFEKIGRIFITRDGFSIDNGLLTPSQKVKRGAVLEKFSSEIKDLKDSLTGPSLVQMPVCCSTTE